MLSKSLRRIGTWHRLAPGLALGSAASLRGLASAAEPALASEQPDVLNNVPDKARTASGAAGGALDAIRGGLALGAAAPPLAAAAAPPSSRTPARQ